MCFEDQKFTQRLTTRHIMKILEARVRNTYPELYKKYIIQNDPELDQFVKNELIFEWN